MIYWATVSFSRSIKIPWDSLVNSCIRQHTHGTPDAVSRTQSVGFKLYMQSRQRERSGEEFYRHVNIRRQPWESLTTNSRVSEPRKQRAISFLRSIPYRVERRAAGKRQARGVLSAFLGNCILSSWELLSSPLPALLLSTRVRERRCKRKGRYEGGEKKNFATRAANTVLVAVATDSLRRTRKRTMKLYHIFRKILLFFSFLHSR